MIDALKKDNTEVPTGFSDRVKRRIPLLFMIWLVLTVLSPLQDLWKAFFALFIVPACLILIFTGKSGIDWRDPFLRVCLVFFAYTGVMTFFVGLGPVENHIRALRWSIEISLGLLAFFIWMPDVVNKPLFWGRLFLWIALIGSAAAVLMMLVKGYDRLEGLGSLNNSVKAASILLMYFALGYFLVTRAPEDYPIKDKALLLASFLFVCLAVLLSQSRGPIAAMVIYSVFLGLMIITANRKFSIYFILIVLSGFFLIWLGLTLFYSPEQYVDRLFERGLSHRIGIWTGYLQYFPDTWLFGFGAGTDPEYHPAAAAYWEPNNIKITHAHNLFIATLADTGVIGLIFLMTLIGLLLRSVLISSTNSRE